MYRKKLCLALSESFGLPGEKQIQAIAAAGFEEIAIDASGREEDAPVLVRSAHENGLGVQSLHAPFNRCAVMWDESGDEADDALNELIRFAQVCSEYEIPVMVSHVFIGFNTGRVPTEAGVDRYGRLVKRAGELGVKVAFENTEGLEFLDTLMTRLSGEKALGFCWDSGHEQCYNYGENLLARYGSRLLCTHLNDNLGIKDFSGETIFTDDLHLLPFDGIIDWQSKAKALSDCGFDGTLTFELKRRCFPGRFENRKYELMSPEEYLAEAYARACRFAALVLRFEDEKTKAGS